MNTHIGDQGTDRPKVSKISPRSARSVQGQKFNPMSINSVQIQQGQSKVSQTRPRIEKSAQDQQGQSKVSSKVSKVNPRSGKVSKGKLLSQFQ